MLKQTPTVLSIPPGLSFANSLARGMIARAEAGEFSLSDCTLLLPNRRAARTLREAFLRLSGGRAVLLPRMQPMGDIDADELSLLLAGEGGMPDIPPAVAPLERQLLLARAIMQAGEAAGMPQSFDQAAALALALGRFLDEVQTERLGFDALEHLVPEAFAGHWQKTLEFLKILTAHWPAILAERGVIDPAARRNLLIAAQIEAWTRHPPPHPVIAAGSTGMVPAVADLLHLVARLPRGMVVLPGLDFFLDNESWDRIGEDHPQFLLKGLLEKIGAARADVVAWERGEEARPRLLSEALRPAETTEKWRTLGDGDISGRALLSFTRIDCDTPQEEADVIALILRGALETEGKTAALITPDRRLARRVALSLRRWGIGIDDSGGQPLTELPLGSWLMLTAEAAESDLPPVTLLSLLKHPVMATGMPPPALRDVVGLLDRLVLRGPRPAPGFKGLREAVEALFPSPGEGREREGPVPEGHGRERADIALVSSFSQNKMANNVSALSPTLSRHAAGEGAMRSALLSFLGALESRMAEFVGLMSSREEVPLRELLTAHVRMAECLAETAEKQGAERLWLFEAGETAASLLSDLLAAASVVPPLLPAHYVSLLGALLKSATVRPAYGLHPRLSILGQVEARLHNADLIVLGGLNEGAWPALPGPDPWMSRPMRKQFGLPAPERGVGIAAHDFVQAAAAPEVFLTRARKVDGTPTVPARWLLRLETVLKAAGLNWDDSDALRWREWARRLDEAGPPRPVSRPAPRPPVSARPRALSVTQVETWMRDPYQIYAKKILGLERLEPVDAAPGGAERGTFIHAALERFGRAFKGGLPDDAAAHLLSFGREAIEKMRVPREVEAFWWPRFEKIAELFVEQEHAWRKQAAPYLTESRGQWGFDAPAGVFTLSGRADRIDRFPDGTYAVIDYKTGVVPDSGAVRKGWSPQLPLEALMLEKGGFDGAPVRPATGLIYWRVAGGGETPVARLPVGTGEAGVAGLVRAAEAGLKKRVESFDDESTPYVSRPLSRVAPRYSDYDHLARVREWAIAGEEVDE